jgi:transcriptional regulator NrdR family protein
MLCPHCQHPDSRVIEILTTAAFDKRVRGCRRCSKTFVTIERVAVFDPSAAGTQETGQFRHT